MKNYKLLVFDWDGTLVNSSGLIVESIQKCATELGCAIPNTTEINKQIGLSLLVFHQQLFPTVDYTVFTEAFHKHYNEEKLATHFFAGALETLAHLKDLGFTLAIATNKPRRKLELALELANIKHLFAATRTPDDGFPKPHPEMMLTLLDELVFEPKDTLMIGDTTFDMEFAQNAGVDALAACYGHHEKERLAEFNPISFVDDIRDLREILK